MCDFHLQQWPNCTITARIPRATIGTLPDDVLLEIFDFCRDGTEDWWHRLVHVCRRWRHIVFESPHRLNLRLLCTEVTPATELLDVWPALPLVITHGMHDNVTPHVEDIDNIIAALKHNERIREIYIGDIESLHLQTLAAAVMQEPFPALTTLVLWSDDESVPVLPDSFLGGCPPRLQTLQVENIPIPLLQKMCLFSPDLVELSLWKISYISPQAMVNCLSALPKLKNFELEFHSPQPRSDQLPPPLPRISLPSLTSLRFQGVSEYLEDLVAQIDIPLLDQLSVTFFNQLIFDISQLPQFLSRTEKFKLLGQANIVFNSRSVKVCLAGKPGTATHGTLDLSILCRKRDWQLSSLAQVCNSFLHSLSTLERLDIRQGLTLPLHWPDDMENTQWLELLRPFTTVKKLRLFRHLVPQVAQALAEVPGESLPAVIPVVETISIEDPEPSGHVQEAIGQFVTARQLSGHPVAVQRWDKLLDLQFSA